MQKSTDAYVIISVLFPLLIPGLCFVLLVLPVSPLTHLSPPHPSSRPFFQWARCACLPSYYRTLTLHLSHSVCFLFSSPAFSLSVSFHLCLSFPPLTLSPCTNGSLCTSQEQPSLCAVKEQTLFSTFVLGCFLSFSNSSGLGCDAATNMFYFQLVIMAGTVLLAYYFEYTDTFSVHIQGFFCFDKAYSKPYPGPEDNSTAPPVLVYSLVTAIPTVTVSQLPFKIKVSNSPQVLIAHKHTHTFPDVKIAHVPMHTQKMVWSHLHVVKEEGVCV